MESVLRQEAMTNRISKSKIEKLKTEDFINMLSLCSLTENTNGIGVIMGDAGTGKTFAVKSFMETSSKAVYITAEDIMGFRNLIESLGDAIGTYISGSSAWKMEQDIIKSLIWSPKTIIIDETEKLMGKSSTLKIEILRRIHDECSGRGTSLILVGSLFMESFLKRKNLKENYGQIDSRIDYVYKTKGLSGKEFDLFLNEYSIDSKAKAEIITKVSHDERGKMRKLIKLLNRCTDIMGFKNSDIITVDIVREAGMLMFEE